MPQSSILHIKLSATNFMDPHLRGNSAYKCAVVSILGQHSATSLNIPRCFVNAIQLLLIWLLCPPYKDLTIYISFYLSVHISLSLYLFICLYRVSQEECARLWEGVPYAKLYRHNPKKLSPKWNGYGDNGQRKVWAPCESTPCTCQLTLSLPSSLNVVSHDKLSAGRWALNFTA